MGTVIKSKLFIVYNIIYYINILIYDNTALTFNIYLQQRYCLVLNAFNQKAGGSSAI